ncbi:amidase [Altererythrobacter sp. MF3-039]|uniref:amidase n=1 Tax=Altererythrobacter sp. MF3-039 TaxID=3252901 RepID=UPI00390CAD3A
MTHLLSRLALPFAFFTACAAIGQTPSLDDDHAGPPSPAAEAARAYIEQIEALDDAGPQLNAVIVYNPGAPALAAEAEREGLPLAGGTVLVKDNIETYEFPTTAGSLALKANRTARDAPLIERLRAAGGVVLGKTNLSEWANIRGRTSTSGWSAIGGLTRNPHATDRTTCGSSSGSGAAVAAGMVWAAIGTETNGSITCPASINGIVGFKPTVGLVSRTHVVPISATQDTAGPMAISVTDTAMLLTAMAGSDPADSATVDADRYATDFSAGLEEYSLEGVRVGVLKNQSGSHRGVNALLDIALDDLERAGAILIPIKYDWPEGFWNRSLDVLLFELRRDMDAYLATLPGEGLPKTLSDVVAFNYANGETELRFFGQDLLEASLLATDEEAYREALETNLSATREDGIDRLLAENEVSFLVAPTVDPAWSIDLINGDHSGLGAGAGSLAAIAGYPHLTVPMGAVEGLPVGLSFMAGKWQDHRVLKAGAAYERARSAMLPEPSYLPWSPLSRGNE